MVFVLALARVGSGVGLKLQPKVVALLFLILAFYEYVAVYKTKYMVKMTIEMVEQKAILGFVVPSRVSGFSSDLGQVKPGGRFLVLGGGDVVLPIIFSVSLILQGFWAVAIVGLFALSGLTVSFLLFIRQKSASPSQPCPKSLLFRSSGLF